MAHFAIQIAPKWVETFNFAKKNHQFEIYDLKTFGMKDFIRK